MRKSEEEKVKIQKGQKKDKFWNHIRSMYYFFSAEKVRLPVAWKRLDLHTM
jgi:hypothetical protein